MESVYLLLGIVAGMLSGLLGVGGGWLVVPALHLLGMDITTAVGTSLLQMIGGSFMGLLAHRRFGNFHLKLGLCFALPTLVGAHVGKEIGLWLAAKSIADLTLSLVYLVVLLYIIAYILYAKRNPPGPTPANRQFFGPTLTLQNQRIPLWVPVVSGLLVGILAAVIGIGGGLLLVPIAVYYLQIPIKTAVGSLILAVLLGSLYSGISYSLSGKTDLIIATLLFSGATVGGLIGAAATKVISAPIVENIYLILVTITFVSILLKQFPTGYTSHVLLFTGAGCFAVFVFAKWGMAFYRSREKGKKG